MTKPDLFAIRWIDLDASLARHCSRCCHSEFIHAESGACLFNACTCQRLFSEVEPAAPGEPAL
jgi:hypothetical protein